jgi:cytochrome c oxidase subunit 4
MTTETHHGHAGAAGHGDDGHGAHPTVRLYIQVFVALMVALALAIAVGYLVGGWTGTILSFSIGIFKAVLILLYFMHVRYGTRLTWIFAGASFLWLGILLVMTLNDYMTRQTAAFRADPIREGLNPIVTSDQERGPVDRP